MLHVATLEQRTFTSIWNPTPTSKQNYQFICFHRLHWIRLDLLSTWKTMEKLDSPQRLYSRTIESENSSVFTNHWDGFCIMNWSNVINSNWFVIIWLNFIEFHSVIQISHNGFVGSFECSVICTFRVIVHPYVLWCCVTFFFRAHRFSLLLIRFPWNLVKLPRVIFRWFLFNFRSSVVGEFAGLKVSRVFLIDFRS